MPKPCARIPNAATSRPSIREGAIRSSSLTQDSRFRPLTCQGTFFQMFDYSEITREPDADFAIRLTRDHGVAAIPISPFLYEGERAGPVLRFCFAKRDQTLERAAERLVKV